MDKVKASYAYAVAFVAAHPAATVNGVLVAIVLDIAASIYF
jgi:hypothetical protein